MFLLRILRVFIVLFFCGNLCAFKLPYPISQLARPATNYKGATIGNDSYSHLNGIIKRHNADKVDSAALSFYFGAGLIPLAYAVISEGTRATNYGQELHKARILKNLLIASYDDYQDSINDEIFFSKKPQEQRNNKYIYTQHDLDEFYKRINAYESYFPEKSLEKEELKSLLRRANKTGVLCEQNLLNTIIKQSSFDPLYWAIASGQFEDRVSRVEAIIKSRDDKEKKIEEDLQKLRDTVFVDQNSFSAQQKWSFYVQLYNELEAQIGKIEDFLLKQ